MRLFCNLIFLTCFLCITISVKASSIEPKIIGGFEANKGQFPYQVSVKYKGNHRCGGTIVNSRHVVTAGHCVVSENNKLISTKQLKVDVGTISISGKGGVSHWIEKIYLSDNYTTNPFTTNDIAVLKIKSSFSFNQFVQPLPLAEEVYTIDDNCTITGWGLTQSSEKKLPGNLHYAVVKIIDPYTCQRWITRNMAPDMLCAGYSVRGVDACQGDSGGSLVCGNFLTGIVSRGYGCTLPGRPGIYTDEHFHKKWALNMFKASSNVVNSFASLIFTMIVFKIMYLHFFN